MEAVLEKYRGDGSDTFRFAGLLDKVDCRKWAEQIKWFTIWPGFKKMNSGNNVIQERRRYFLRYLSGIIIMVLFVSTACWHFQHTPTLAESVLRLHVVANSDSPKDQQLKLEVKDQVVEMMQKEFADAGNVEEARTLAIKKIPRIRETAAAVIAARGLDYPVQVEVGEREFPTKSYGNIVLPQGNYQAVDVVIGAGQGKNWWCVLFPPLCLVSSSDKGLSVDTPSEAKVSFKCLELIPKGLQLEISSQVSRK